MGKLETLAEEWGLAYLGASRSDVAGYQISVQTPKQKVCQSSSSDVQQVCGAAELITRDMKSVE